jgi:putative AlgH/UPF0301 family transcriptional regulator
VLVTLGYSGWGAGQLEDELGRNGWLTVPADPAIIFDTPVDERYMKALALLGIDPRMLSQEARMSAGGGSTSSFLAFDFGEKRVAWPPARA